MSARLSKLSLISFGIIIGALIFVQWPSETRPVVYGNTDRKTIETPGLDRPIHTLRDLNAAYIEIAGLVKPTVVTIQTEKVLKVRNTFNGSPFFSSPFDLFFRDFQGLQPRRQQPEPREYRKRGLGSGVIVSEDGYILTNNHVIEQADTIYIHMLDKRVIPATVIGADPKTDIAVLKVDAENLPAVKLGNSDQLQVGEMVLAVGSPMTANLAHTVTSGIVSATGRSNVGVADYEDFIQTDAAINPGNSGGALINMNGELIGINTAIASQSGGFQGIGFAVPVNMARNVMESLINHGAVIRGYLGVYIQDLNPTMAQAMDLPVNEGALISDVVEDGPAGKAGMKAGDVVIAVNDKQITSADQLRNEIASTAPDSRIDIRLLRDGEEMNIEVTLDELAAEASTANAAGEVESVFGFRVEKSHPALKEKYSVNTDREGVIITSIDPSGAAFQAGLREGDLIIAVNRKPVKTPADLKALADDLNGGTVLFQVVRQDRSFFIAMRM